MYQSDDAIIQITPPKVTNNQVSQATTLKCCNHIDDTIILLLIMWEAVELHTHYIDF